ncbi:MAG TPA: phosphodiester glycosidase family protein, partial [Gemmataceae bacterium]|nr:phosphodiester glycosidase family protein [Gemmataceae bacterium]
MVLAARGAGAAALADLARQPPGGAAATATLRVGTDGIVSAIGGSPQLLESGRIDYPAANADDFTQGRHPRTVVGLTPAGEVLLVTVDGSPTSAGLTLAETTRLLAGLGATDALNLDGGGSTT